MISISFLAKLLIIWKLYNSKIIIIFPNNKIIGQGLTTPLADWTFKTQSELNVIEDYRWKHDKQFWDSIINLIITKTVFLLDCGIKCICLYSSKHFKSDSLI